MSSFSVGIVAVINLGLLFLLQWIPVVIVGVSRETDLFFSALVLPQLINAIFGSNIVQVLTPVLVEEGQKFDIQQVFGELILFIFIFALLLFSLCFMLAPGFVEVIYSSFSAVEQKEVLNLIRVSLVSSIFALLVYGYSSLYYVEGNQLKIEWYGTIAGLVAICFYGIWYKELTLLIVIWGINLRWMVLFALLMFRKGVIPIRLTVTDGLKNVCRRISNLVLGGSIYKSDLLVDRYISAQSDAGDLTILHVVQQVYGAITAVFNKSFLAPRLAVLSGFWFKSDALGFELEFKKVSRVILKLNLILFSLLLLAWFSSRYFEGVSLGGVAIQYWLKVAALCSGVIIGGTLGAVYSAKYYARGNTIIPTIIGVFGFLVGIGFKVLGFKYFGFEGLVLAISAYYIFNLSLFFASTRIHHIHPK